MATDPTVKGTMTSPLLSRRNILLGGFGIAATATVGAILIGVGGACVVILIARWLFH